MMLPSFYQIPGLVLLLLRIAAYRFLLRHKCKGKQVKSVSCFIDFIASDTATNIFGA